MSFHVLEDAPKRLPSNRKHYLGGGVYADYDGYAILLTAENGLAITTAILLEPSVFEALQLYVEQLAQQIESERV